MNSAMVSITASLAASALLLCAGSAFAQGVGAPGHTSDAPLMSPTTLAHVKKSNPKAATDFESIMASGKMPSTMTASELDADINSLPVDVKTQVIAALKADGLQVSAANAVAAPVGRNPFNVPYNVKEIEANIPPVSSFVSFVNLSTVKPQVTTGNVTSIGKMTTLPVDVSLGRVSGIILSGGAHAIYEADGVSNILQPGDPLPDGAGRLVSIDANGIIVRISGDRYVRVNVSAGSPDQNQQGPGGYPPGIGGPGFGPLGFGSPGFGGPGGGGIDPGA